MPANEVKRRKNNRQSPDQEEVVSSEEASSSSNCKDETQQHQNQNQNQKSSLLDLRSMLCVLSVAACAFLTWVVLQQNERFSQMEDRYVALQGQTARLFTMEEEVLKVSKKCEEVQGVLEGLEAERGVLRPQLEALQQDVAQLQQWEAARSEERLQQKRAQLHGSVEALSLAVDQIQQRTSSISQDVNNKVASVRTDVRRMQGLQTEVESLLEGVARLENRTASAERSMVRRIGDVLAGSIDRAAALRSSSERNAQGLEALRRRVPELTAGTAELQGRLRDLEGGRARLLRTVTFASDLKPKVSSFQRDLAGFEPRVSDLVLRIGRLAEDVTQAERDVGELRRTMDGLGIGATEGEGDLDGAADTETRPANDMSDNIPDVAEMLVPHTNVSWTQAQSTGD